MTNNKTSKEINNESKKKEKITKDEMRIVGGNKEKCE